MQTDFLIVGSGLTGAVIARELTDAGFKTLVVDRRSHLGGNVHDHAHESGIRIHTYGPHYFRTSSDRIWSFVNRFSPFFKYEASLKTLIGATHENWPIAREYIERTVGSSWTPAFSGEPKNFEEASLKMMPQMIYEQFVKGYTEKQWGVPAASLSADLAGRFDVREDNEPRLKLHRYQGIPERGYAHLMESLLNGIPVLLNFDYLKNRDEFTARRMVIFTGPIDEYFGFDLGKLAYRGQRREHQYLTNTDTFQPCGQVNYPDPKQGQFVRVLEWKHMMPACFASRISGTVISREYPCSPQNAEDYEYPFPSTENQELYKKYLSRARDVPNLLVCGRLGEYRYFDMDQAIGRAMMISKRIIDAAPVLSLAQAETNMRQTAEIVQRIANETHQTSLEQDMARL